jgi:hypothetical protein
MTNYCLLIMSRNQTGELLLWGCNFLLSKNHQAKKTDNEEINSETKQKNL